MKYGKVYIVGGGPGDKGLMTVKGANLLKNADVVVYDRLVGDDIIKDIPKSKKLICVGKNAGNHPIPQHRINEILVEEAKKGNTVIRLKGGDPYLFGRGGEEIEVLVENNIEFEEVPGITSSIAVPAYAGIPVTHREYCSSVHIITGHAKNNDKIDIDFDALVRLGGTLVFMMSVSSFDMIAEGLIKSGMKSDMPCAVIQNGTLKNQRSFVSPLCEMARVIKENNVRTPAVIIVGEVCRLSEKLSFFENKVLFGKKIIVVQSQRHNSYLADILGEYGADVNVCTCTKTVPFNEFDTSTENSNVIVFTSAVGVKVFFDKLYKNKLDARSLFGKKIACVGQKTADSLKEYGVLCDFVPSVYDGESLAREMIESGFISDSDSVLMFRNEEASKGIVEIFDKYNIKYCDRPIYRVEYITENKCSLNDIDYVTFISKSGVESFVKLYEGQGFCGIKAVCIGKTTAEAAAQCGFDVIISDEVSMDSMAECIINAERKM